MRSSVQTSGKHAKFVKVEVFPVWQNRSHIGGRDAHPARQFGGHLFDRGAGQEAPAAHLLAVGQADLRRFTVTISFQPVLFSCHRKQVIEYGSSHIPRLTI